MVIAIEFKLCAQRVQIELERAEFRIRRGSCELRNDDRGEHRHDQNHDHDFDQREGGARSYLPRTSKLWRC